MRSLLQQAEKRCEDMKERESEAVHQVEQLQMDVDELTRANARYESVTVDDMSGDTRGMRVSRLMTYLVTHEV